MNLTLFEKKIEPIFICGHRKSGTTLLLNLLDNQKELILYPHDINIFYALDFYFRSLKQKPTKTKILERLDKILFNDLLQKNEINNKIFIEDLKKLFFSLLKKKDLNLKNIHNFLFFSLSKLTSNNSYKTICKETSLEIYFEELIKIWPNAKFIQIIRDPRDNIGAIMDGLKNRYSKFGDSRESILHSSIFRINLGLKLGIQYKRKYPKKFMQIKFEELISNPDKTLKSVYNFLNLKPNQIKITPSVFGIPTYGNSHSKKKMYDLSSQNINRWSKRLSLEESMIIEHQLKTLLIKFNYKLKYNSNSITSAISKYYNYVNYKYFYFDRF